MPYLNVKERVIEAKVVYYGAGLSGKTTNLERIKEHATEGRAGDMMSLETDGDRTLFFDWLPFHLGKFNGCDVKVQLYTVPGQAKYSETRKKVLAKADGVVLVLDSEAAALEKNRQSVKDLLEHLAANNLPSGIPLVVQLNKRDLPSAMPPEELLEKTGLVGRSHVSASASRGEGVFETLREVTRLVLESVRDTARAGTNGIRTGGSSGLDGNSLYASIKGEAARSPTGQSPAEPTARPVVTAKAANASSAVKTTMPSVETAPAPAPPVPTTTPKAIPSAAPATVASVTARTPKGEAPTSANEGPPSAQLGEVIAGHRALQRRLDQLETTFQRTIDQAIGELEKRLAVRLRDVGQAIASGTETSAREITSQTATLTGLEKTTHSLVQGMEKSLLEAQARATEAAKKELVNAQEALGRRLEGVPTLLKTTANVACDVANVKATVEGLGHIVEERIQRIQSTTDNDRARTSTQLAMFEQRLQELDALARPAAEKTKSWWR